MVDTSTIDYYSRNAITYCERTWDLDLGHLYRPFLKLLPSRARILDAGSGPGRDTAYFQSLGHQVVAFDASPSMASMCRRLTKATCLKATFDNVSPQGLFDGIWACASLLHVPPSKAAKTYSRLARFLKEQGVWFVSLKAGEGKAIASGRSFYYYNEETISNLIAKVPQMKIVGMWRTEGVELGGGSWLNLLLRKARL